MTFRAKYSLWLARLRGSRRPFPKIGHRTFVDPSAQFLGSEYIEIGDRCIVSEACWFNISDRSGDQMRIVIGDHCYIGRRTFINCGLKITIGPYCMISHGCNLLGADHDFSNPFRPYLSVPVVAQEIISISANCWVGANCSILKGVSIGFGSVIGAGSVITHSIPPLCVAVGSPYRVVRRFSLVQNQWVSASEWTPEDEKSLPSEEKYLAELRSNGEWIPMPYIIGGCTMGNL
jgi:acetyltransferase-like isoleucine patch superfamily enzyme